MAYLTKESKVFIEDHSDQSADGYFCKRTGAKLILHWLGRSIHIRELNAGTGEVWTVGHVACPDCTEVTVQAGAPIYEDELVRYHDQCLIDVGMMVPEQVFKPDIELLKAFLLMDYKTNLDFWNNAESPGVRAFYYSSLITLAHIAALVFPPDQLPYFRRHAALGQRTADASGPAG